MIEYDHDLDLRKSVSEYMDRGLDDDEDTDEDGIVGNTYIPTNYAYFQDCNTLINDMTQKLIELVCDFIPNKDCDHDCQKCCGNRIRDFLEERNWDLC